MNIPEPPRNAPPSPHPDGYLVLTCVDGEMSWRPWREVVFRGYHQAARYATFQAALGGNE